MSLFELLDMYSVFKKNRNNPDALAKYYFANQRKIEALKARYPEWRKYAEQYPTLRKELRKRGVPI